MRPEPFRGVNQIEPDRRSDLYAGWSVGFDGLKIDRTETFSSEPVLSAKRRLWRCDGIDHGQRFGFHWSIAQVVDLYRADSKVLTV